MKIYEIGTGYTPIPAKMGAATEIVVEELTRSLRNNGEDAEIIDIKAEERGKIELPITEVNVPAAFTKTDVSLGLVHKLKRVVYSVALSKKLKKILKAAGERVILHFHNQYNLYFFLKLTPKKLRKKAVIAYTVHSYIWGTDWSEIESTIKKKYFQEVYCVRHADIVFVLNDITAEHLTNKLGVDGGRIHKILNGVNTRRYAPLPPADIDEFKRYLGLESKKVILQVGSVCERKNQLGTVRMLADYMRCHKDAVYLYAGGIIDEKYYQSIVSFADNMGISEQVIYTGEIAPGEELNKYYNIADYSVFNSKLESFGLVIIEAISSGTPVLIGGDLMFDLGGGYNVYRNKDELTELIDRKPAKNTTRTLNILKEYDWDTVAESYAAVFRDNM